LCTRTPYRYLSARGEFLPLDYLCPFQQNEGTNDLVYERANS
jgi:hypothetical protein